MRIIRNNDPYDDGDDPEPDREQDRLRGSREPQPIGDILADQVSAFLAQVAAVADDQSTTLSHDAPVEPRPDPAVKPALRLVTTGDTDTGTGTGEMADPADARRAGTRVRLELLRAGIGGTTVVVAAAAVAGWGQPAVVVAPIAVYGLGWIAFLWWNAALRPPLRQVLAVIITACARGIAAAARGVVRVGRAGAARIETARTRHETTRTATAPAVEGR
ncbi:hypothetical protein IU500_34405 [Nocardia terpenica]|uniref:hypothetical protein n=1 Tax=Nocardia terpenica TaxID=455432 RepID=UPI0018946DD8|nr:hypothetical protein [Nocardia terpenica]MBF6065427.1 hypothetical protein [Nocardia terpenica]MBF6109109.1 hypothetical protein [Nocardia terpenica]MBF6114689.1 hypothetical protein [Nocardia terpenica]MBF6123374.1 hypothetical protein [Nocardia terpenica]MBF6156608.1 hypothetical protein [Nocardia terpenica]